MATGIRIRNTAGSVQIDDSYQNLALRSKGAVVSGGSGTSLGWYAATVTLPASVVVAFRCAASCLIVSQVVNGASKQVNFLTKGTNQTVAWYAFDTADFGLSSGGNYGLRVRTKTGAVAFDSRMKYMRVLSQIAGSGQSNAVGTYNFGAGQLPAVVQGPLCYVSDTIPLSGTGSPDPQVQYLFSSLDVSTAASSITVAGDQQDAYLYDHASQLPAGLKSEQNTYSYLVLDVANF